MSLTTARQPGNLPAELNSFVGRRRELSDAKRLLGHGRIVTLTGVGGVGKTRLALRIASEVRRAFPDGVWFVDLAQVESQGLVAQALAETLGCQNHSASPPLVALSRVLEARRVLLVLDNCEHLLPGCADVIGGLLSMSPELRILATSRQLLGVTGEFVLETPPLSVPASPEASPSDGAGHEAVTLFAERAAAVQPGFTVTAANRSAVVRLCRRLDGLPLAIELAAALTRILSVEQIFDRLDDRFRLLARRNPAIPPRQRTLRAMVDWSYDRCSPEEQLLWARLSVFVGGFDLDAAEHVCSGDDIEPKSVLDLLFKLVDKSILIFKRDSLGVRYEILETLREYGQQKLVNSCQATVFRKRHRDWFRQLALRTEEEWFGPGQAERMACIKSAQANFRAAIEFCLGDPGEAAAALEMAAAMWSYRFAWISLCDGRGWLDRALEMEPAPSSARAKALWVDAWIRQMLGDRAAAVPLLRQAYTLAERLGDEKQLAGAVQITGLGEFLEGRYEDAFDRLSDALERFRRLGEKGRVWAALVQLSMTAIYMDHPRSAEISAECLAMCERDDAQVSRSVGLWIVGLDKWRRGDSAGAAAAIREGLQSKLKFNDQMGIAQCIEVLAWVEADKGQDQYAAELLGSAHVVWRLIGTKLPGIPYMGGPHERYEERLRRRLGERPFAAAYGRGAAHTLDGAVRHALDKKISTAARDGQPDDHPMRLLTRREREVAALVTQGKSNREIAAALVIAQRTAEGHVERILQKLGFTSRSQIAAAWAEKEAPGRRSPGR